MSKPSLEPTPRQYRIRPSKAKHGGDYAVEARNLTTGRWELQITTDDSEWAKEWAESRGGFIQ